MSDVRPGADAFLEQLIACGVRWIFGNPGTALSGRLADHRDIDLVRTRDEGVAVAAADGYARATGEPGVVDLRTGLGLGNGLGDVHNAYVAHTPLLICADRSEPHQEPAPSGDLGDLVGPARPVTKWAHEVRSAEEIPQAVRRALEAATTPPCGPVLLSIPAELREAPCSAPVRTPGPVHAAVRPDPDAVTEAAQLLLSASAPLILVGDGVATACAIETVGALGWLLGAPIVEGAAFETTVDPDDPLGAGRLPADPAAAARLLGPYDTVIAVGTWSLAQVFPEPGPPLGTRDVVHIGIDAWESAKSQPGTVVLGDERETVREIAERVDALLDDERRDLWTARYERVVAANERSREVALRADRAHWHRSPMSPQRAIAELASAVPENACVVDESRDFYELTARYLRRGPGRWFRGAGGIGTGLPRPIGVQLAVPGRPVVSLVAGDASTYALTALWTAAHHDLPIVWVVIGDAVLDLVAVASGMGVTAHRVTDPNEITATLRAALASGHPTLIDLVVDDTLTRT